MSQLLPHKLPPDRAHTAGVCPGHARQRAGRRGRPAGAHAAAATVCLPPHLQRASGLLRAGEEGPCHVAHCVARRMRSCSWPVVHSVGSALGWNPACHSPCSVQVASPWRLVQSLKSVPPVFRSQWAPRGWSASAARAAAFSDGAASTACSKSRPGTSRCSAQVRPLPWGDLLMLCCAATRCAVRAPLFITFALEEQPSVAPPVHAAPSCAGRSPALPALPACPLSRRQVGGARPPRPEHRL